MKRLLVFIFLIYTINTPLIAKECGKMNFHFSILNRNYAKDIQLCKVHSDRDVGFVSQNCLERKCPVLKTNQVLIKKEKYAINKIKKLCENLKGIYLEGFLEGEGFKRDKTLCFFKSGTIISGGYLYYVLKNKIEYTQ